MTNYRFSAALFRTVYRFTSKEKSRYYLNGLHVSRAPGNQPGVMLAATDGHKLIVAYDPDGFAPDGKGVILRTEGHKLPGAVFKEPTRYAATRMIEVNPDDTESCCAPGFLFDMDENGGRLPVGAHMFEVIDGDFPDITRVVPRFSNCKPVTQASTYDANYLKAFTMAAADFCNQRSAPISIWSEGPNDPALVTFGPADDGKRDLFGVLMPLRANAGADAGRPQWFDTTGKPLAIVQEPEKMPVAA
jgi:hypothetical protein